MKKLDIYKTYEIQIQSLVRNGTDADIIRLKHYKLNSGGKKPLVIQLPITKGSPTCDRLAEPLAELGYNGITFLNPKYSGKNGKELYNLLDYLTKQAVVQASHPAQAGI